MKRTLPTEENDIGNVGAPSTTEPKVPTENSECQSSSESEDSSESDSFVDKEGYDRKDSAFDNDQSEDSSSLSDDESGEEEEELENVLPDTKPSVNMESVLSKHLKKIENVEFRATVPYLIQMSKKPYQVDFDNSSAGKTMYSCAKTPKELSMLDLCIIGTLHYFHAEVRFKQIS